MEVFEISSVKTELESGRIVSLNEIDGGATSGVGFAHDSVPFRFVSKSVVDRTISEGTCKSPICEKDRGRCCCCLGCLELRFLVDPDRPIARDEAAVECMTSV